MFSLVVFPALRYHDADLCRKMPATIFYRRVEMKKPLPDKVAIINGGATGMGRSIALCFAEEGCSCVSADINEIDRKKTAAEAAKKGRKASLITSSLLLHHRPCVKCGRGDTAEPL
jgi:hypothetical protein